MGSTRSATVTVRISERISRDCRTCSGPMRSSDVIYGNTRKAMVRSLMARLPGTSKAPRQEGRVELKKGGLFRLFAQHDGCDGDGERADVVAESLLLIVEAEKQPSALGDDFIVQNADEAGSFVRCA